MTKNPQIRSKIHQYLSDSNTEESYHLTDSQIERCRKYGLFYQGIQDDDFVFLKGVVADLSVLRFRNLSAIRQYLIKEHMKSFDIGF